MFDDLISYLYPLIFSNLQTLILNQCANRGQPRLPRPADWLLFSGGFSVHSHLSKHIVVINWKSTQKWTSGAIILWMPSNANVQSYKCNKAFQNHDPQLKLWANRKTKQLHFEECSWGPTLVIIGAAKTSGVFSPTEL